MEPKQINVLGFEMSNPAFKRVALMIRDNAPRHVEDLRNVIRQLKDHVEVVVDSNSAAQLSNCYQPIIEPNKLKDHADLIITIGGDGSLINGAHVGIDQDLPVLGINRGRLGFLTDIPPDDQDALLAVLAGEYSIEDRLALTVNSKSCTSTQAALNDIVISPGTIARMIQFELKINKQLVYMQRADGLIIATPTGSTAYALSGGGPIITPGLPVLTLVPMFPHKLSSRPIVVGTDSDIEIKIIRTDGHHPQMSCDGRQNIDLTTDDHLQISKHGKSLRLVHPTTYNYFATLRNKLGWEKANENKQG